MNYFFFRKGLRGTLLCHSVGVLVLCAQVSAVNSLAESNVYIHAYNVSIFIY